MSHPYPLVTVISWSSRYPDQMVDLHPGMTTTHPWMSAETMSTKWRIPVKTSLMAPAQILSKDYENQTSPLHRSFLPASPTGMMFLQAEKLDEIFLLIAIHNLTCDAAWNNHTTFIRLARGELVSWLSLVLFGFGFLVTVAFCLA